MAAAAGKPTAGVFSAAAELNATQRTDNVMRHRMLND